jgi:hypothetical protein
LLYSTTGYFLEHFGLKSVQDLPNAAELGRMNLPKAAVSEDKAAKQREKDENEPELPLDAPVPQGSAGQLSETQPASDAVTEPARGTDSGETDVREEASGGLGPGEGAGLTSDFAGDAPSADEFPS